VGVIVTAGISAVGSGVGVSLLRGMRSAWPMRSTSDALILLAVKIQSTREP